jgi:hypothetical protein
MMTSNRTGRFWAFFIAVAVGVVFGAFGAAAHAADVTLAWDPNTEPDLAGYRIHYGSANGSYSTHIDVHRVTTYTVTGLTAGQTYYLAATAYNASGKESGYSNQVSYAVPSQNGAPTTPATPTGAASAPVNTAVTFSTTATDPNGDSLQYRYDWGGGVLSSWGAASQSRSWTAAGQYAVKAQARDSRGTESGWSGAKAVTITQGTQNAAPTTPATPSGATSARVNRAITFSTTATDPNGDSLQYRYDWGGGVTSSWGAANQSRRWTAAGQYAVKAQARDSRGAESSWSSAKTVTITQNFRYSAPTSSATPMAASSAPVTAAASASPAPATVDSDGDGVPDSLDAFPKDPKESADANKNGIGDNADLAAAKAPDAPIPASPVRDAVVSATPALKTGSFRTSAAGTTHAKTRWQVFGGDDAGCVLDFLSTTALTGFSVPKLVLDEGTAYFWRAQFIDSKGAASAWSDYEDFSTQTTGADRNANGIPDIQEVSSTSDLDRDGVRDRRQTDLKVVNVEGTSVQMGISTKGSPSVLAIEALESGGYRRGNSALGNSAVRMPFGFIDFRLAVVKPGDRPTVKVYFSDPAPVGSRWYRYDAMVGKWQDASADAQFAADRRSLTLTLTDGGNGDADGAANGVVVSGGGVFVP